MAALTDYKGLEVVNPDPTGAGGLAIQNDFKKLVDWQAAVISRGLNVPPVSPPLTQGDRYIVGTAPTGVWLTPDDLSNQLVEWDGSAWQALAPQIGFPVYVTAELQIFYWDGAAWQAMGTGSGGTPAGLDAQVQFNNAGAFGADAGFTFDSNLTSLQLDNLQMDGNTLSATDTNGSLILTPNGSGAIQIDSAGDTRGFHALDLQDAPRGASTEVASGDFSFLRGFNNTASGIHSSASGASCKATGGNSQAHGTAAEASGTYARAYGIGTLASGPYSLASGFFSGATAELSSAYGTQTYARLYGQHAQASGGFYFAAGSAQSSRLVLRRRTTDSAAYELMLDGSAQRLEIPTDTAWDALIRVVAAEEGMGDIMSFDRRCCIKNDGGTASLVGTVDTIGADKGSAGWSLSVGTSLVPGLAIEVSGAASTNIRWVASVDLVEVAAP